jgi:hypothetical protein
MDYKVAEKGKIIGDGKNGSGDSVTTQGLLVSVRELMEEVAESPKKNSILREISSLIESLSSVDLSVVIEETGFIDNLFVFVKNTQTCFNSLEIISLLFKNSKQVVKMLFDRDVFTVLIEVLSSSRIPKNTRLVCSCMSKSLKKFNEMGVAITITPEVMQALLTFASGVNESFQKEYSKIIYYLIKFTDVSAFIDDIVAQCLIILERRISNESVKYVLLQIEEIAEKYPSMIECFLEFPVLEIVLKSALVNTDLDSVAIMNTINTFIKIDNESIHQLIKEELRVDDINEVLKSENEAAIYAALELATTAINASLINTEWIRNSGFIDNVLEITSIGQIDAKIKAIVLLLEETIRYLLTNEEKMKLVENGIDLIPEMHKVAAKFISALYEFGFKQADREAFVELYENLDVNDALESCEKTEEIEVAIEQLRSIL